MAIVLDGTTGITTPGLTNTGTETLVNLTTTGNTILGDASTDTLNVGNGGLIKDASGNVGIGVTPSAWGSSFKALQMPYAAMMNVSSGGYFGSNFYYNSSGNPIYVNNGYANAYSAYTAGGAHLWLTAPSGTAGGAITWSQAMTLDASGRLGIGQTSPSFKLDVTDDSTGQQGRFASSSSSGTSISLTNTATNGRNYRIGSNFVTGSGEFAIYDATAAATRLLIDSSGNLGVGTASPNSRLQVSNSSASSNAIAQFTNGTTGTGAGNGLYVGIDTSNEATIFNFYNSALKFGTNGVERARLSTTGNLTLTGGIFPAPFASYTVSTNTWVANTFYEIIAPGTLANYTTYWITVRWDHGGGGGPFIMATAFMFSVVNTNGTGADNTFTPLTSSHTGGGGVLSFRSRAASGSSTGLEASANSIVGGTMAINIYKFV